MGRSALPTTLVFCCPVPADMPAAQFAACLDAVSGAACPVTWATPVDRLPLLIERCGAGTAAPAAAVDVPVSALASRQALRQLLAAAQAAAPGLEMARVRGTLAHEQRRMLVDAGIGVVVRDRLESVARGSRRPAPHRWPCRSVLWGLWEVAASEATPPGMIGRLLPWTVADRPQQGGLTVVDLAGVAPTPASIRDRLERWLAWSQWQGAGRVEISTLSTLPDLISGAARRPLSGSVLKAA
jgi:hypothetical protein